METLAQRPFSSHPGDHYLSVVLRKNPQDKHTPYVTHIFNNTLAGGKGGHVEGHYFKDLDEALKDFQTRR